MSFIQGAKDEPFSRESWPVPDCASRPQFSRKFPFARLPGSVIRTLARSRGVRTLLRALTMETSKERKTRRLVAKNQKGEILMQHERRDLVRSFAPLPSLSEKLNRHDYIAANHAIPRLAEARFLRGTRSPSRALRAELTSVRNSLSSSLLAD